MFDGDISALAPVKQAATSSRRQRWMFLALIASVIFATIFENYVVSPVPFLRTPFAILGVLLAGIYITAHAKTLRLRTGPDSRLLVLLAVFALITLVNVAINPQYDEQRAFYYFMAFSQPGILFLVLSDLIVRLRAVFLVWFVFFLMTLMMAVLTVAAPDLTTSAGDRSGFGDINYNRLAFAYALSLLSLFWILLHHPRTIFRHFGLMAVVIGGGAVITWCFFAAGSRGAFLAFSASLLLLMALELRKKTLPAYIALFIPAICLFISALVVNGVILERLYQAIVGSNTGMRDDLLIHAADLASQKPWLGHSYQYFENLGRLTGLNRPIDVHNGIFQIILQFGYPALIVWFWFLFAVGWRLWSHRGNPVARLFLVLFSFNVAFMFIGSLASNTYFWIFLACAVNAHSVRSMPLESFGANAKRLKEKTNFKESTR